MVKIAIMGHGVVGSGVVEVLNKNGDSILKCTGERIEVARILDLKDFEEVSYSNIFTKNFDDILSDEEISVVVETIGGLKPSYDYTVALLKAGKSVVSSNKEVVSQKGAELLALAKENGVNYLFEASVGGGTPIVKPIYSCLSSNKIESIKGILNGTTNFIMTMMFKAGLTFEQALELSQKRGYAEKDPSADIEGIDAGRKICILASLAFGKQIYPAEIHKSGIANISVADVSYAQSMGCVVKLVGIAKMLDSGKLLIMVCPAFIPVASSLASTDGVFNAISVRGNFVGEVLFVGAGAGKMPTASAVVSDIIDVIKADGKNISPNLEIGNESIVSDYRNSLSKFYLRWQVEDEDKAKGFISRNYASPVFLSRLNQPKGEIAFKVDFMVERKVKELTKIAEINGFRHLAKLRIFE